MTGTGIAQPADVGLQRLLKHHVKRSATDFVVGRAMRELAAGVKPKEIKLPTKLPILRNASIAWLLDAYNFFAQNQPVVLKAWTRSNCVFKSPDHGDLDLS